MAHSIVTHSMMNNSMITHSVMTYSMVTHSMMTYSMMTYSMTHSVMPFMHQVRKYLKSSRMFKIAIILSQNKWIILLIVVTCYSIWF